MQTQKQMFYSAQKENADTLQHALYMAGLGEPNSNPLTIDEVRIMATSNKRYSWAFALVLRVLEN